MSVGDTLYASTYHRIHTGVGALAAGERGGSCDRVAQVTTADEASVAKSLWEWACRAGAGVLQCNYLWYAYKNMAECSPKPWPLKMATLGLSKVFILDKYFTELQKFWETEKKLQGVFLVGCVCGAARRIVSGSVVLTLVMLQSASLHLSLCFWGFERVVYLAVLSTLAVIILKGWCCKAQKVL